MKTTATVVDDGAGRKLYVVNREALEALQVQAADKYRYARACADGIPGRWHVVACQMQWEGAAVSYTVRFMLGIDQ